MFSGNTHKILRCSCIRRPTVISHQNIQFLYISIILYDCVAMRFSKFQTQKHIKKTKFLRSASQANLLCSGVTSATSFPRGVPSGLHICAGVGVTSAGGCIPKSFKKKRKLGNPLNPLESIGKIGEKKKQLLRTIRWILPTVGTQSPGLPTVALAAEDLTSAFNKVTTAWALHGFGSKSKQTPRP